MQDTENSLSAQETELKARASSDGFTVADIFSDSAKSGRIFDRPEFQRMIATAKQKPPPWTRIYCWSISRFGRNRIESATFKQRLRSYGIEIVYLKENIDDTGAGRLVEALIEAISEFESCSIAEDTRRGHREITRRGFYHGGTPPYGLRARTVLDGGKEHKALEPDPEKSLVVKWIYEQRLAGKSPGEIARELNEKQEKSPKGKLWGISSVTGILTNTIYAGKLEYGRTQYYLIEGKRQKRNHPREAWTTCEEACEAIVGREVWDAVQKSMTARRKGGDRHTEKRVYLLSGIVACAQCGKAMVGTSKMSGNHKQYYYYCRKSKEDRGCTALSVRADRLEKAVLDKLKEKLSGINIVRLMEEKAGARQEESRQQDRQRKTIEAELRKIEKWQANLTEAIMEGLRPKELQAKISELGERKDNLEGQLRDLEKDAMLDQAASTLGLESLLQDAAGMISQAEDLVPEDLRDLLKTMVRVEIDPEKKTGRVLFTPPLRADPCIIHEWRSPPGNDARVFCWTVRVAA